MEFKYSERLQHLTQICLNVTDSCNLACKYCFVNQKPHFMSFETAKTAIDWIYSNAQIRKEKFNDQSPCVCNFFGGEPTLAWDSIIVPLVDYAEKTYPGEIQFSITTNGTLLDSNKIQFFKKHKFGVLVSCDGNEYTQNYNRPSQTEETSFNLISKNFKELLYYFPCLIFRATIYADTVEKTFENYLFAESVGFKNIFFIPDVRRPWTEEQRKNLEQQIQLIYTYRLKQLLNKEQPMGCMKITESFQRALVTLSGTTYNQEVEHLNIIRCGLGTTTGSIGYDGTIYGCQEQVSPYEDTSIFRIGNIYKGGIDPKLHANLLSEYYSFSINDFKEYHHCQDCLLQNYCTPDIFCPSTNFDLTNDLQKINELSCFFENLLVKNALATYQYFNNFGNPDQQDWFYNYIKEDLQKAKEKETL